MEWSIESLQEAILMNKVMLQKLVADTYAKNSVILNNDSGLQQFEEYAQKYFNVNAFSLTTFYMTKTLSIPIDYYQTLIKKIESYSRNNNIFLMAQKHPDYDLNEWTVSYKTMDFLKKEGFIPVYEHEQSQKEDDQKTKKNNSLKLRWEGRLIKWQAIVFWPLFLIAIASFVMSIFALLKK